MEGNLAPGVARGSRRWSSSRWLSSVSAAWAVGWALFALVCALAAVPVVRIGAEAAPVGANWLVVAGGGVGAVAALAVRAPRGRQLPGALLLALLWGVVALCAVAAFGLLMALVSLVFTQTVDSWYSFTNQVLAAAGAVLFFRTAHLHRSAAAGTCPDCGSVHDAPVVRTRPEPAPASRRVRYTAYAGVVAFLPYMAMKTVWALGGTFAGVTNEVMTDRAREAGAGLWVALDAWGIDPTALAAALGAVLLVGLVSPWGQVFPRWVPFVSGRPILRWLPLTPALLGVATLLPYGAFGVVYVALGTVGVLSVGAGDFPTPEDALLVSWLGLGPFFVYGTALAVAARSYARRTRPRCVAADGHERGSGQGYGRGSGSRIG